ncbi:MAG: hypothetical protein PHG00_08510 [Methylococcales bacterium]|nr:hypothetical protein [Methylococcales bacterium]
MTDRSIVRLTSPKALTSGAFNAPAIMIAATETGPTDKVRLVPGKAYKTGGRRRQTGRH